MKSIIRNVISRRTYDLSDMLKKIDTLWVQGSLTDEEREELIALARENAQVQQSIDIIRKLEEMDLRVKALEDAKTKDSEEDTEESEEATYLDYVVGKWYYKGDVVIFEGKAYECIAPEGAVCIWSPSEYPPYWEVYVVDSDATE